MMRVEGTFEYAEDAIRLPYREQRPALRGDAGRHAARAWSQGYGTVELPRFTTTSVARAGASR